MAVPLVRLPFSFPNPINVPLLRSSGCPVVPKKVPKNFIDVVSCLFVLRVLGHSQCHRWFSGHSHRSVSERVKGIEPSSSAWKAVALPLSYTRKGRKVRLTARDPQNLYSLIPLRMLSRINAFDCRYVFVLRQQSTTAASFLNVFISMGGAGFEPAKAMPSDLQSDPFDRSGNPPVNPCTHDPCERKSPFEPITV